MWGTWIGMARGGVADGTRPSPLRLSRRVNRVSPLRVFVCVCEVQSYREASLPLVRDPTRVLQGGAPGWEGRCLGKAREGPRCLEVVRVGSRGCLCGLLGQGFLGSAAAHLPSPGRTWLVPASVGCSEGFLGLPEARRGFPPSPLPPLPEFLAAAGGVPTWFLLGGGVLLLNSD